MDLQAFAQGLSKIVDANNGNTLNFHRRKQTQYESWVMPLTDHFRCSLFALNNEHVYREQTFFDRTASEKTKVDNSKLQFLYSMQELEENWDGNGAVKPDNIVIENAVSFMSTLPFSIINDVKQDKITATPYGTLVLNWEKNNQLISVEIGESELGFFSEFVDNDNLSIESTPFDKNELPKELLSAFKKLYL